MAEPRKVVVADDEEGVRLFVAAIMEAEGWQCHEARNGEEAVDLAERLLPDLIILDVVMPVMDGFEAFTKLRSSPFTGHIPIIVLTALNEERGVKYTAADLEAAFDVLRPDDFIEKPVDADFLRKCIMGVIG